MSGVRFFFREFLPAASRAIGRNFEEVAKKGLDERDNFPVRLSHFLPYTRFKEVITQNGDECGIDLSNADVYWRDDPRTSKVKCLALFVATPLIHAIGLVLNLANRVVKVVSLAHFWHPSLKNCSLADRSFSFGRDLLRVAFTPIIYVGLELSAFYGLMQPDSGKKLYATFERCAYGKAMLAPCFQPFATRHLGGGIPGRRNEW